MSESKPKLFRMKFDLKGTISMIILGVVIAALGAVPVFFGPGRISLGGGNNIGISAPGAFDWAMIIVGLLIVVFSLIMWKRTKIAK